MENSKSKLSAERWYGMLPAPALMTTIPGESGCRLRRFEGGDPVLLQPSLTDHVVAIHLGGAKRVTRWQGGRGEVFDVSEGSITLMPAGLPNRWLTEGAIDYAHLVVSADFLHEVAQEELAKDPGDLTLVDKVGAAIPVVSSLLRALLQSVGTGDAGAFYQQSAVSMIVLELLRNFSSLTTSTTIYPGQHRSLARSGMASWQLRRLTDWLRADLRIDADASAMARLIGVSRGHLFRAFKVSTGVTPLQFINHLRVEKARSLLRADGMSLAEVAKEAGFRNERHLARNIRAETGLSLRQFTSAQTANPQAPPELPGASPERVARSSSGHDRHGSSAAELSGANWEASWQDG